MQWSRELLSPIRAAGPAAPIVLALAMVFLCSPAALAEEESRKERLREAEAED